MQVSRDLARNLNLGTTPIIWYTSTGMMKKMTKSISFIALVSLFLLPSFLFAEHGTEPVTTTPIHSYTFSGPEPNVYYGANLQCNYQGAKTIFTLDKNAIFNQDTSMCLGNKIISSYCNFNGYKQPGSQPLAGKPGQIIQNVFHPWPDTTLLLMSIADCGTKTCVTKDGKAQCVALAVTPSLPSIIPSSSPESEKCDKITIKKVVGDTEVQKGGSFTWQLAKTGMMLDEDDFLQTGFESSIELCFPEKSTIIIEPLSQVSISGFLKDADSIIHAALKIKMGGTRINIRGVAGSTDFRVKGPNLTTAVRGTIFDMAVSNPARDALLAKNFGTKEELTELFEKALTKSEELVTTVILHKGVVDLLTTDRQVTLTATGDNGDKQAVVKTLPSGEITIMTEQENIASSQPSPQNTKSNKSVFYLFLVIIVGGSIVVYFWLRKKFDSEAVR